MRNEPTGKVKSHKGDKHSGGGGKRGGGGKKGRPPQGWEKGDVARDVDDLHSAFAVPAKPGKRKLLLEDSPEMKAEHIRQSKAEFKNKKGKVPISVLCDDELLHKNVRETIIHYTRSILDKFKHLEKCHIRFETIYSGDNNVSKMCRIKVWMRDADSAVIYFASKTIDDAFAGALPQLESAIRQSMASGRVKSVRHFVQTPQSHEEKV